MGLNRSLFAMQVPQAMPSRNSIDHPGASTAPLTQISSGAGMPTECPEANLQRQLGSKIFARTTAGAVSRLLSLACRESIPELQTHDRNLRLAPFLAAALFQTVPFSLLSLRLDLFTSTAGIQASSPNSGNLGIPFRRSTSPSARRKGHLHRAHYIVFWHRPKNRKGPVFVLNGTDNPYGGTHPKIGGRRNITQCASAGDECLADLLMPVAKLNFVPGSQPIAGPGLRTLTLPANPASDQVAVVSVSASISGV